jgi:hypothetical protein
MKMRGSRRAAFVVGSLVLAHLAGCSSCVKEDEPQPATISPSDRPVKPLLKGMDQKLTAFSADSGGVDASTD